MSDIVSKPNDSTEESLRKAVKLLNNPAPISLSGGSVYVDGGYLDDMPGWVSQGIDNARATNNWDVVRVTGMPSQFKNLEGIYQIQNPTGNSHPPIFGSDFTAQVSYKHVSAYYGNIGDFAPQLVRQPEAGNGSACRWFLRIEEDVASSAVITNPSLGGGLDRAQQWTAYGGHNSAGLNFSTIQIQPLTPIPATLAGFGATHDYPATDDSGGHSLMSFFKRLLQRFTELIGNTNSSAATSDTGTFSLISLFKRLLSRLTTLVPANLTVTSTRLLVDGSGVTQPISGTITAQPRNGPVTKTRGTTSSTANTSAAAPSPLNATNNDRRYLFIQNISDTDMYVNFGAAATTDDLLISKNGGGIVFESGFVPTDSVNVICSAASKKYFILSA